MNSELVKAWVGVLKFFLFIAVIFILLFIAFATYIHQSLRAPRHDSTYIGYLEYYVGDSLPSCRVIHKKYYEDEYSSAICRLDKADFEKLLEGVRACEDLEQDSVVNFNKSAIELLRKEDIEIEDLDFKYSIVWDNRIGFKYPDLIIYDITIHD